MCRVSRSKQNPADILPCQTDLDPLMLDYFRLVDNPPRTQKSAPFWLNERIGLYEQVESLYLHVGASEAKVDSARRMERVPSAVVSRPEASISNG
jgi:hypothetical protein